MRTRVKLKSGEAAIIFKSEGIMLARGDQEEQMSVPASNAACIVMAMQHPLFMQIVVNFLQEVNGLVKRMETETIH